MDEKDLIEQWPLYWRPKADPEDGLYEWIAEFEGIEVLVFDGGYTRLSLSEDQESLEFTSPASARAWFQDAAIRMLDMYREAENVATLKRAWGLGWRPQGSNSPGKWNDEPGARYYAHLGERNSFTVWAVKSPGTSKWMAWVEDPHHRDARFPMTLRYEDVKTALRRIRIAVKSSMERWATIDFSEAL